MQANAGAHVAMVQDDVAKDSVLKRLTSVDYLFLAADSMRSRLIFNELVHNT